MISISACHGRHVITVLFPVYGRHIAMDRNVGFATVLTFIFFGFESVEKTMIKPVKSCLSFAVLIELATSLRAHWA